MKNSIIGAVNKATSSVCFVARILGVISQKISTKKDETKVATTTPTRYPAKCTKIAVIIADMAILTKSLPMSIAAINLSSLFVKRWILWALRTPLAIILRRRILLKAMTAISEAEKRKEKSARKNRNNIRRRGFSVLVML